MGAAWGCEGLRLICWCCFAFSFCQRCELAVGVLGGVPSNLGCSGILHEEMPNPGAPTHIPRGARYSPHHFHRCTGHSGSTLCARSKGSLLGGILGTSLPNAWHSTVKVLGKVQLAAWGNTPGAPAGQHHPWLWDAPQSNNQEDELWQGC